MTPLVKEMVGYTQEAETFMWFDLGKLPTDEMQFVADETLTHIPFPKVIVCFIDADGNKCMVALIGEYESVAAAGFILTSTSYEKVNAFAYVNTPEGFGLLPTNKGDEPPTKEQCYAILCTIKYFLNMIGQTAMEAHQPLLKRSLINDKRKVKGKFPLMYDWHTVVIEPQKTKSDYQGGTHASPRRHQARGHWRTYASGKRGWVKECWRGDATKGTVFKDYQLKEKNGDKIDT